MARIEIQVYGKTSRSMTYEDVEKARAYIRKKAKEGFDATHIRYFTYGGGHWYISLSKNSETTGACRLNRDPSNLSRTPGYQKVVHDYPYSSGTVMNYRDGQYIRQAILDSDAISAEDIQTLLKAREVLDRLRGVDKDNLYYVKDAYKELNSYLEHIKVTM